MTFQKLPDALKYFLDRENYDAIDGILLDDENDKNNLLVVLSSS